MAKAPKSPETMTLDFEAVKKLYNVRGRDQIAVVSAFLRHPNITPKKIPLQSIGLQGISDNTFTSVISRLRGKGVPIESLQDKDDGMPPRKFTRYSINREKVAKDLAAAPK